MLLTLSSQGQPCIAFWPNWLVQLTPTEYDRKWAQNVCQNSPSAQYVTGFQTISLWDKICDNLPFCILMLQTTPIRLHLWYQVCPLCQASWWQECCIPCARLTGTDGEWHGHEPPSKIGLLFCTWQLLPTTALQEADYMHFKVCRA